MTKEMIIKWWVDALRSGRYTQCRYKFWKGDNEYCATGLLIRLAWRHQISEQTMYLNGFTLLHLKHMSKVIELNDNGVDFNKIADYIEENYK